MHCGAGYQTNFSSEATDIIAANADVLYKTPTNSGPETNADLL